MLFPSLLRLVVIFLQSSASVSISQSKFHFNRIPHFNGIGITSIASAPVLPFDSSSHAEIDIKGNDQYYVGTKRGRVIQVSLPPPSPLSVLDQIHDVLKDEYCDDETTSASKQYPIFSLMCVLQDSSNDFIGHDLLAGGADKYVTVWKRRMEQKDEGGELHRGSWLMEDQLGPHTGWVKDMAFSKLKKSHADDVERVWIFSIGCNCIEVWSRKNNGGKYHHIHKLKIESSVKLGSTLSSDILCIATTSMSVGYNSTDDNENGTTVEAMNFLFAGGVDGRIHLWTMTTKQSFFDYVESIPAHHGRVNAMVICPLMSVLITVGNDSSVHCRLLTTDCKSNPSQWDVSILNLVFNHEDRVFAVEEDSGMSSSGGKIKITSLCIVDESARRCTIAIGTSCGKLAVIDIVLSEAVENFRIVLQLRETIELDAETDESGQEANAVIHALCAGRRYENIQRILVGHSRGLTVWDVSTVSTKSPLKRGVTAVDN